ncbi:MAG: diguanylate cyclase [Xenococcaceae cyanobacterium]
MKSNQADVPKGNILVVDDIIENLNFLSLVLNKRGYKVRSVNNGQMALKTARTKPPDVILLDIKMPFMNGYEVCQALKADEQTHKIPVIFLSALDEVFDKVKAFQVGGVDYISKPFEVEEVLVRIENQLTIQKQKALLEEEIRAHQKTEEILYQSRALLASVLNSSLDGVAAFQSVRDNQGNIIDFQWLVANPVAARIVGKTAEKLIGKRLLKELPGVQEEGLFNLFFQVVETSEVLNKEYSYEHDSLQVWFQIVAVKLGDGFAVTFRDITERKQMELALQEANLELQLQANLDGLTQVANRRRFDECFPQEWRRCAREKLPLSLIMCDVDYFKSYNDTYAHQAGDDCLKHVAQAISRAVKRPADLVVRYGGEEFAVILPNTPSEGAVQVAEAIRDEVQQLKIPHAQSDVSEYVTLSLGVSSIVPTQELSPEALIAAADKALYQAKEQGRDLVKLSLIGS